MSHYKPYPAYKGSGIQWIGEVPEHWKIAQLKRLVSINNGTDHKAIETNAENGFPVYGSGGIFAYATSYIYDGESVLLGRKGTIDKPLYVNGKFWTVDTMYWTKIRPNAYGKFCFYVATTIPFNYYATNTALPSMTQTDLGSHMTAFPDHKEQKSIADTIDTETTRIDALIAKKTRFIELLKEKRQAFITHAVTKGLDPDVPMKDSGIEWIGEVPEHWEIARLKNLILSCQNGVWGNDPLEDGTDTLCIRVADFDRERLSVIDNPQTYRQITQDHQNSRLVEKGDLLLEKSGGGEKTLVGANVEYMGDEKAVCSNFVAVIKVPKCVNSRWLNMLMASMYDRQINIRSIKQSTGIQNLDSEQYLNEKVAYPQFQEQDAIVKAINQETTRIDALIKKTQRSIELLKERRSAFITAAVTGQIDVRNHNEGEDV